MYKAFERTINGLKFDEKLSKFDKRFTPIIAIGEVIINEDFDFLYRIDEHNLIVIPEQDLIFKIKEISC